MWSKLASIGSAILLPNSIGWLGAYSTRSQIESKWYKSLKRPWFQPPRWVFPVVWTSLYTTMGYASYLVHESGNGFNGAAKLPLTIYGAHLVLNGLWSQLFFVQHRLGASLLDIIALDILVACCICTYLPVNQTAAYLMIPYMAWASFATILNSYIWWYNKDNKIE
ncbi:Translocator protein [Halotydeus destructor]|nr:Translocator protein [Halotydeus destructor]